MNEIVIVLAGFASGLIGSIAGGGGAFIPFFVLLGFGLPTPLAIGTMKLGNVGIFPASIINFFKADQVDVELSTHLTFLSLVGGMTGAFVTISISESILNGIIAGVLIFLLIIYLRYQNIGLKERPASPIWPLFYLIKSVYTGMFGAGSGIFSMATLTGLRGMTALKANANNHVASLFGTLVSVGVFAYADLIHYRWGLLIFFGNIIGSFIGSKMAIRKGDIWVRWALIVVIAVTIFRLLAFA